MTRYTLNLLIGENFTGLKLKTLKDIFEMLR